MIQKKQQKKKEGKDFSDIEKGKKEKQLEIFGNCYKIKYL